MGHQAMRRRGPRTRRARRFRRLGLAVLGGVLAAPATLVVPSASAVSGPPDPVESATSSPMDPQGADESTPGPLDSETPGTSSADSDSSSPSGEENVLPAGVRLDATASPMGERRRGAGRVLLYLVKIRPVGGVARDTSVALAAERPLRWAGRASGCSPGQDRAELSCALGDLSDRRVIPIAVRVPGGLAARSERRAIVPRVVIVARAGNASAQTVLSLTPRLDGTNSGPTIKGESQRVPNAPAPGSADDSAPGPSATEAPAGGATTTVVPAVPDRPESSPASQAPNSAGQPSGTSPQVTAPNGGGVPQAGGPGAVAPPLVGAQSVRPRGSRPHVGGSHAGGGHNGRPRAVVPDAGEVRPRALRGGVPQVGGMGAVRPPFAGPRLRGHHGRHSRWVRKGRVPALYGPHTVMPQGPGAAMLQGPGAAMPQGPQVQIPGPGTPPALGPQAPMPHENVKPLVPQAPFGPAGPPALGVPTPSTAPSGIPMPTPPSQQGPMDMPTIGAGVPPQGGGLLSTIRPGNGLGGPAAQNDVLPGAGDSQMTLVSPISDIKDARDWAVVLGIVLVAEIVLLWGVACLSLLRRRMTLSRPGAPSDDTGERGVRPRLRRS
ncbi:hypothetical protein AB0L06_10275 [Spirillospora sp. NPDC052269]